ncbi:MAG: hypothetical protein CMH11_04945 [Maritimibacter sp.]|nr:hypothetical protein [Maritimibacter sp.]
MKIREIVESGQPFHCHKGLPYDPKSGKYDAPAAEKGRVTVCAGWLNARVAHLRKSLPDAPQET